MNQFSKVFKFELKNYLANKVFVGVTLFLMLLIVVVMFFPNISAMFSDETDGGSGTTVGPRILIVPGAGMDSDMILEGFSAGFPDNRVEIIPSEKTVREQITSGGAQCAFVFNSLTDYTYYVDDLSLYDYNAEVADRVITDIYRMSGMISSGLTPEEASKLMQVEITHSTKSLGVDQTQNFFYTYIMIFALYMCILIYGQMIASNVASEKSSRTMELLITSVKPVSMMFGKVLSSCLAGLCQLILVFGTAFVCYNINGTAWGDNPIISSIFGMPIWLLIYMLVFFLLGFLLYAFMYGAIGSTVSKLEEVGTAIMPVTFLFIIAFVVVMFYLGANEMNELPLYICSFVPFTSPMAMFTRIAMSNVPGVEIAISIGILVVSVIAIGILASKIYRVGVLMYGNKVKLFTLLKNIKNA